MTRLEPRQRRLAFGGAVIAVLTALLLAMLMRPEQPAVSVPVALSVPPPTLQPTPAPEPAPAAEPAASPEGLRLRGIAGAGAIIDNAAGGQRLVTIGREVSPGLVLERVGLDHVILRSPRGPVRLDFAGSSAAGPRVPAASASAPGASEGSDALPYQLGLAPRRQAGRIAGHVFQPGASLPALERAGLQAGDVIVAVNGSRFDQERLMELPWTLANSGPVTFEIERGGRPMRLQSR